VNERSLFPRSVITEKKAMKMSRMAWSSVKQNPALKDILAQPGTASLAVETSDDVIHFLVTATHSPNYRAYCHGQAILPDSPVSVIRQYTEHTTQKYAQVNLSLASDSVALRDHGKYIKELRASVLGMPLLDDCPLFRGVELSQMEIDQMEKLRRFFIPSFTSTSVDSKKAYDKNATLVINTGFLSRYACTITPELSDYHGAEKEVLIACYSAFQLERVEFVNRKHVINLFLDEHSSSLDKL
jgi:hypothetical protein